MIMQPEKMSVSVLLNLEVERMQLCHSAVVINQLKSESKLEKEKGESKPQQCRQNTMVVLF